uniref:Uncharacterized protein n=1 Tax=Avena sativa TaxID=4498 RepID=A0ACD5Y712_AVESA
MTLFPHLKNLKPINNMATNNFLLKATGTAMTTLVASIILLRAAERVSPVDELLLSQHRAHLRPVHLFLPAILLTSIVTVYLLRRPKTVYLVDYACFKASHHSCRFPKATFLEHAYLETSLSGSTVNFMSRVLQHSGMGEETWAPPPIFYINPNLSLDDARAEAELVVFSTVDDLLAKTCISFDAIDVLITNCSLFSPEPSIADRIVNRYMLRGDIRVINLSGMGCSAGVTAVGLARNLLQVIPSGSHVLVVSTETIGPNYYTGNRRSMLLANILFRMGGNAMLLSTCTYHHITSISSRALFIYRCEVETVKLNFHLELYATLDCNLNSGLCLELQVWCALVSHKV